MMRSDMSIPRRDGLRRLGFLAKCTIVAGALTFGTAAAAAGGPPDARTASDAAALRDDPCGYFVHGIAPIQWGYWRNCSQYNEAYSRA